MTKPSLHELIKITIYDYIENTGIEEPVSMEDCDALAERIIKIIRDYHLTE